MNQPSKYIQPRSATQYNTLPVSTTSQTPKGGFVIAPQPVSNPAPMITNHSPGRPAPQPRNYSNPVQPYNTPPMQSLDSVIRTRDYNNKKGGNQQIKRSPIRILNLPGSGKMGIGSKFIGPPKGGFNPSNFGGKPPLRPGQNAEGKGFGLPVIPKVPQRPLTLEEYDNLGITPANDPREALAFGTPMWEDVNGNLDFPADQWKESAPGGYWGNSLPTEPTPPPAYDYMGRPLGLGQQVIWDAQGNVIPEIAAMYEAQGLPVPGRYDPNNLPAPITTGTPSAAPTEDIGRETHLGSGRPTLSGRTTLAGLGNNTAALGNPYAVTDPGLENSLDPQVLDWLINMMQGNKGSFSRGSNFGLR